MRNVLLIIKVPDATNSRESGCSSHGASVHEPHKRFPPRRPCRAASASTSEETVDPRPEFIHASIAEARDVSEVALWRSASQRDSQGPVMARFRPTRTPLQSGSSSGSVTSRGPRPLLYRNLAQSELLVAEIPRNKIRSQFVQIASKRTEVRPSTVVCCLLECLPEERRRKFLCCFV